MSNSDAYLADDGWEDDKPLNLASSEGLVNGQPTMSDKSNAYISFLQDEYEVAKAAGDTELMENIHNEAEAERALYGFSGGADGSEYIPLANTQSTGGYTPVPSATSQDSYINELADAQTRAAMNALDSAYRQNMLEVDETVAKIPGVYQDARNQTAAQSELSRQNFNVYAAASGLNTGAGGQAQLSMANTLSGNMGKLNLAESQALKDIEKERLKLQTAYNSAIAQAQADGDLLRAQLLFEEAVRVDNSVISAALNNASLGLSYQSMMLDDEFRNKQLAQEDQHFNQSLEENKKNVLYGIMSSLMQFGSFDWLEQIGLSPEEISTLTSMWKKLNRIYS